MKQCITCRETKPLSDYGKSKAAKSGFYGECNSCRNRRQREWAANNREKKKAWGQRWRINNREKARAISARWALNNPIKKRVYRQVYDALKSGELVKEPCEKCGVESNIQAHHDDYSKPLDVRWLCPRHHTDERPREEGS